MLQKLYRIQPAYGSASAAKDYQDALQELVDGPEEVVQLLMLDAPLPSKPVLLVLTNLPGAPAVEHRG